MLAQGSEAPEEIRGLRASFAIHLFKLFEHTVAPHFHFGEDVHADALLPPFTVASVMIAAGRPPSLADSPYWER